MEALQVKSIPKSYPGVFVQTSMKDIPFDYDAFMKSFHVDAPVVKPTKKMFVVLDTFTMKKIGLVTIPEFIITTRATCNLKFPSNFG